MTLQTTFKFGSQRIIVRVIETTVLFIDLESNMMSPFEGLELNKKGVEKEYPDLIGDKDWKQKAIQRFVDKIKNLPTENLRMDWIISELKEMGYEPLFKQRKGFRTQKIR